MAKVSMDCPTPGCKKVLLVKKNKIGKPMVFCEFCGFQGVVRYAWAVKAWFGEEPPAEAPADGEGSQASPTPAAQVSPPAKPPADAKPKKRDLWDMK